MLAPSSGDPREGRFDLLSTTLEYAFLGATYKYSVLTMVCGAYCKTDELRVLRK